MVPAAAVACAVWVLASLQSHERQARTDRLLVQHLHEDALLQHTLVSHAVVMGYVTRDLVSEARALHDDAANHLRRLDATPAGRRVDAAWRPFESEHLRALAGLANSRGAMTMGAGGSLASRPAMTPPRQVALGPTFQAAMTAIGRADTYFRNRADRLSSVSLLGSAAAVGVEALVLALLFGGLAAARRRSAAAAHRAIVASEERFRSLAHNLSDVVVVLDRKARTTYVSPSVAHVLGHSAGALTGGDYLDIVHPDDHQVLAAFLDTARDVASGSRPVEFRLARADGGWVAVEALASSGEGEAGAELVLTARDMTERKELEHQLRHQAFHDSLTGLPNRALFTDRLSHALARRSQAADTVAVLFLDVDDFKTVNDSLGHESGDEVLTAVAARVQTVMREADTAARFGGDEFAVLIERVEDLSHAEAIAARLIAVIGEPLQLADTVVRPGVSIGIALGMSGLSTADQLLRESDVAMYAAKRKRTGATCAYEPDMHAQAQNRLQLKSELEQALVNEELTVHYQPTVALDGRTVTGFEALVRWRHPVRGMVAPNDFIPLAEETGLIVSLGNWVLRTACAQAAEWHRAFPDAEPWMISVNLSIVQLRHGELVDQVVAALRDTGLDPGHLMLEITESALIDDAAAVVAKLNAIKALGVRLAIDDFGTGYASLSQLRELPVDVLKIDKSFVDNVATGVSDTAMTRAIIEMGEALSLELIAEGIEHESQAAALRRMGCRHGQGFMFARPLAAEDASDFLAAAAAPATADALS